MKKLLAHELVPGTSPITDSTYGSGNAFVCAQGAAYYIVLDRFQSHIRSIDAAGVQQEILGFDGGIQMFDMRGGATVFVGMQKNSLQELYVLAGGKAVCISAFNSPLLSARAVQPRALHAVSKPCRAADRRLGSYAVWL